MTPRRDSPSPAYPQERFVEWYPLPLSGPPAEEFFREAEAQVLDRHHTTLRFWSIDPRDAFSALLMAIDSHVVVMAQITELAGLERSLGLWQYMKACQQGYVRALGWAFPRASLAGPPSCVPDEHVDAAGEWLVHAAAYAQLEVFHISYGFGLYDVQADTGTRTVRFVPKTDPMRGPWLHLADLVEPRRKSLVGSPSQATLKVEDIISKHPPATRDGRVDYRWVLDQLSTDVVRGLARRQAWDAFGIPPGTDFGPFSCDQFMAYWDTMQAWSFLANASYLHLASSGIPQGQCMPTQFVPADEYRSRIAEKAQLPISVVDAITDFITYGNGVPSPDPFLQPVFRMADTIAWSTLVVTLMAQPRNVVKLLSRTPATRNAAATINGARDRGMLDKFGKHLQRLVGYSYKLETPVSSARERTDIDLLAYRSRVPNEVLIVQGKATIAPDDPHEIMSVTEEMQRASRQCAVSERILRGMTPEQKQRIFPFVDWPRVDSYFGLTLTPDSEPNSLYGPDEVPCVTLVTVSTRLKKNRFLRSPSALCAACRDRPWLQHLKGKDALSVMTVGDVRYEMPLHLLDEEGSDHPDDQ